MPRPRTATDEPLRFELAPTPAVLTARSHNRFVLCPACQADSSGYLFHQAGVRFVRCTSCGAVYVNPGRERPLNDLDIERARPFTNPRDRELMAGDFERLLEHLAADHQRITGKPLARAVLLGRYLKEFAAGPIARRIDLAIAEIDDPTFERLAIASDIGWAKPLLTKAPVPQLVILHELLESCSDPGAVLATLIATLPPSTLFVVTYTNTASMPARLMRRYWSSFFNYKTAFLSTGNLTALLARYGLVLKTQYPLPVTRTTQYIGESADRSLPGLARLARATPLRNLALPVRAGNRVAVFGPRAAGGHDAKEKLSIIMPVFNEARYAAQVIDAVLAKQLKIDREVIIVESNSTDGTREIVRRYEGRPGVRVVLEDQPRGKGHAVRTGFAHMTGSIVLIQDADFEYDIDDYDALLEPLLQHKTMFVLGSRSLGLDDWKVRKYDKTPLRGLAFNFAQILFAKTYNLLYQQRVTDVPTMFKVFRAECLDGFELHSNGFELDIELACKLVRNGHAPMEIPVNYVARGFDEGKKVRFWRDAIPCYGAFFRYRFT